MSIVRFGLISLFLDLLELSASRLGQEVLAEEDGVKSVQVRTVRDHAENMLPLSLFPVRVRVSSTKNFRLF